jgi:hypothetical protein
MQAQPGPTKERWCDWLSESGRSLGVPLKAITSKGSRETKDVNRQSPINKPKKNRFGV